jgi:ferredoxin
MSNGESPKPKVSRRGLFGAVGALAAGTLGFLHRRTAPGVRPPGAAAEPIFKRECIRCFRCAEVCPVRAIVPSSSFDLFGLETPVVEPRTRACILCMKCTEACPTDALTPVKADLATVQEQVRMGRPMLNKQSCITWSRRGSCKLCFYACPYAGSAVKLTGFVHGPLFVADKCVGCGLCEEACPEDSRAIRIIPLEPVA